PIGDDRARRPPDRGDWAGMRMVPDAARCGALMRSGRCLLFVLLTLGAVANLSAQTASDEALASRQFQNGRLLLQRRDYEQALKDFRAVTEIYPNTSVADNAWLEIGRYYLEVVGDVAQASSAAELILNKYRNSDSAPWAYLIQGEILLGRSRMAKDLAAAQTTF